MIKPELAKKLADYQAAGEEIPERVKSNPFKTEGEMMKEDEIEEYVKDSIATLRILADRNSARWEELYQSFCGDILHLVHLGRMSEDDYNELTHKDNLHF